MKRGLSAIVFSLSLALGFTPSSASEHKEEKKGAYVNYAHRFHPGTGLPEEMHKNPQ